MNGDKGFRGQDLSGVVLGDAAMSSGVTGDIGVTRTTFTRTLLEGMKGLWQNR
ncbi:hypothetical protein [Primorskyibacter marinus]|uniref:hypothetical protein n=1 Tax=Primorskyibacter marinus TaxID=1977320 RepID=UPI00130060FE|nr:hypothetical protein [Primorskyibacter marinus]